MLWLKAFKCRVNVPARVTDPYYLCSEQCTPDYFENPEVVERLSRF